ncbi:MAG: ion transporter [Phycisphaeraceae bacterium]|nr:MAG: ion transporter [Phycisphaeraceae bacterium]
MEDGLAKDGERGTRTRERLRLMMFETGHRSSRVFNTVMLGMILLSVLTISLETVESIASRHGGLLRAAEWGFTILFTAEYVTRLVVAKRRLGYATSFFGIVDVVAIAPTYLTLLVPGMHELLVIRSLRLVRLFRILRLAEYVGESEHLAAALRASRPKIVVFVITLLTVVVILGAVMHLVEGPETGFTSIPQSMYWAVVTMTTVGYGDLIPTTPVGKMVASVVMILGYGLLAVPTGIVTSELTMRSRLRDLAGGADAAGRRTEGGRAEGGDVEGGRDGVGGVGGRVGVGDAGRACPSCGVGGHAGDARYCRVCGAGLL